MNPKLKSLIIDFDSLKVGSEVWDIIRNQFIKIIRIDKTTQYPLVTFHGNYCKDGNHMIDDTIPTLWKSNPFDLISEYPKEMLVRNGSENYKSTIIVYEEEKLEIITWYNVINVGSEDKAKIIIKGKLTQEIIDKIKGVIK